MKFIKLTNISKIIFAVLLSAAISNILASESTFKSTTEIKAKNNLALKIQNQNKLKSKSKNVFSFQNFYGEPPAPTQNNTELSASTPGTILSDWLMVSSRVFKNPKIFPEIFIGYNLQGIKIKADMYDFRLNDAFKKDDNQENNPQTEKAFWFRLRPENVFYSSTKSDANILGGVRIDHIEELTSDRRDQLGNYCFTIFDSSGFSWKICSEDQKVRNKWVCAIQKLTKKKLQNYCSGNGDDDDKNTKYIIKNIVQPYIIVPIPSKKCNQDWNYQNHGEDWECDCAEGKEQSPIDLPKKDVALEIKDSPLFKYSAVDPREVRSLEDGKVRDTEILKLKLEENALRIKAKFGKAVTPDGSVYDAEELIIHTPSEHKIDGKGYDMEIQIVHNGKTVGDIGRQLILSFLFEKKPGVYNKFIDDLDFFNLPNHTSRVVDIVSKLNIPKIFYSSDDSGEPKMKPFSFYTYQGSLTAPPCSEDTIVYVASKPIELGSTALHMFQESLRVPDKIDEKGGITVSDWIPMSNRDVQPINGRPVFHFNHEAICGPDKPKKNEDDFGHYERVKKISDKYFYVPGITASGIPNSFVVSKNEAFGVTK